MFQRILEKFGIIRRLLAQVYLPVLDTIVLALLKGNRSTLPSELLVVRVDGIGDFVIWLDAAKELRTLYPRERYRITLLGNRLWTELAAELSYFDDVWHLDKVKFETNIAYRIKTLRKVRNAAFDTVIQPTFSREFIFGDTIIRASSARQKIGFQSDDANISSWQQQISDRWYTRLIPASREPRMELERNAEFMRGLGLAEFTAAIPRFSVLSPMLPKNFGSQNYYVLFPAAGHAIKRWPLPCFREIADRLYRRTGWTAVVCGGPADGTLGERLAEQTSVPIENWAGRTSLRELIGVIAGARLLIGNDTSAIHIAAAVSTPSVCVVGGGHFGRFLPYKLASLDNNTQVPVPVYRMMNCFNCGWRCVYPLDGHGTVKCIHEISIDAVWGAIDRILSNSGNAASQQGTRTNSPSRKGRYEKN